MSIMKNFHFSNLFGGIVRRLGGLKMDQYAASSLYHITNEPGNPMDRFRQIVDSHYNGRKLIEMNLANLDKEYGVLNRAVLFTGLTQDEEITFCTEKSCRKYQNFKDDPRVAVTFRFTTHLDEGDEIKHQIRVNGSVHELPREKVREFWDEMPTFAKIRSIICKCGAPVDWDELKTKHDELLARVESGDEQLDLPDSFVSFRIVPIMVDFYEANTKSIADRLQYRRADGDSKWEILHVAA